MRFRFVGLHGNEMAPPFRYEDLRGWGTGQDAPATSVLVCPAGHLLAQLVRRNAGELAVNSDDQVRAGLDRSFTSQFRSALHGGYRGAEVGVFGFGNVFWEHDLVRNLR